MESTDYKKILYAFSKMKIGTNYLKTVEKTEDTSKGHKKNKARETLSYDVKARKGLLLLFLLIFLTLWKQLSCQDKVMSLSSVEAIPSVY